jgi:hypothetical protein
MRRDRPPTSRAGLPIQPALRVTAAQQKDSRAMRYDGLRTPLTHRRRDARAQAADAAAALAALRARGPHGVNPSVYQRWIDALAHRAAADTASLQTAAASMNPPMTKETFAALLRRAHHASGVAITQIPLPATGLEAC